MHRSLPDAIGVQLTLSTAVDILFWCNGILQVTETGELELRLPREGRSEAHGEFYVGHVDRSLKAHRGDWILFDSKQFQVVSEDELEVAYTIGETDTLPIRHEYGDDGKPLCAHCGRARNDRVHLPVPVPGEVSAESGPARAPAPFPPEDDGGVYEGWPL